MRTITVQADPAIGDEWLVHTVVAMPVTRNEGIIFDDDGATSTHINRRQEGVWTVSFRNPGIDGYPRNRALPQPLRRGARHHQPRAQRGRRALMDTMTGSSLDHPPHGGVVQRFLVS